MASNTRSYLEGQTQPSKRNTYYSEIVAYAVDKHKHHMYLLEIRFSNVVLPEWYSTDTFLRRMTTLLNEHANGTITKIGIRGIPTMTDLPADVSVSGELVKLTANTEKGNKRT